jgi:predicted RNA-binding protein YlqC (UPF0109 family)
VSALEGSNPSPQFVQAARILVVDVARGLVDCSEAIEVGTVAHEGGISLCLKVATKDLGKVIGKQDRTARAIRTILAAASMKAQVRLSLDIQPA